MPSNSSKQSHRGGRKTQNGGDATAGVPQISEATLKQAGEIAQKLLGQSMQQGNNATQTGGSAGGQAANSVSSGESSIKQAMVGGAVAGAVAGASMAQAAESKSGLNMSPLVGGKRRKGKSGMRKGRMSRSQKKLQGQSQSQSQSESENQNQNQNQNQTGGMVPGLMAAVETALVPLGLYLGQKALQSRRSGKSFGRSFNFRRFSRRGRSRSSRRR